MDWDDRNHVCGADAWMGSPVLPQIDPLARAGDSREERCDQLLLAADERVDGPMVVGVRMDVEQPRLAGERIADRLDRRAVAPLGEVRDGLERQHRAEPTRLRAGRTARTPRRSTAGRGRAAS